MMNIFVHKTLEGVCFHNLLTKHSKVSASITCLQSIRRCLLPQHASTTCKCVCFHNMLTKHSKVPASTTCLQNMQRCLLPQHAYKTCKGVYFHNMLTKHWKVSECLQNIRKCLLPQHAYKLDNGFLDIFLIQSPFFLQGILYGPNYTFFYKKTIFFAWASIFWTLKIRLRFSYYLS